ncbi:recombination regulator RecX [Streptomyces sp. Tu 6176]|uniref:recombination regulator RecX n=1 Tax=Streptomyces sp. Tu 6176 TaxID=1470557 RepID=UPI000568290D|nr:recombination regulator RecX [Streptomyces sp. Tu 6176]
MTRRTDWPEYSEHEDGYAGHPDTASGAPRGRGTGDRYGTGAFPDPGPDPGLQTDTGPYEPYGLYGPDTDGGDGQGTATGSRTGGARRGGSRDGGPYGGRGRRRRGSGGAPVADGDISSPRAEQGESPGDPVERARAICLRQLTGTPRTRRQLADALRKREIPDEVAEEVLSRFEEVGLIDDGAFADAWVESRHHGRGLARRALAQELRTKGVDTALIDEAVGRLDAEQEEATARELIARKLRSTRGLDRDKRMRRLAGMLARKGYSQGLALRLVRQALEEEGEDTGFLEDGD